MTNQFELGSEENPLPVPEEVLKGNAGFRMRDHGNGLVYNVDDGRYYQYPQSVVEASRLHMKTLRTLKTAIIDFHTAFESMQIDPKNRVLYERYISTKEELAILVREHWQILAEALKIDV